MFSIIVNDPSAIGEARRKISQVGEDFGFPDLEVANLAIIAVEAANNLIKHTSQGGKIVICPVQVDKQHKAINLLALDKGGGIINFSKSMEDGYSTAGTAGIGLGAIKRLSSAFDMYTLPGLGTILWAQILIHSPSKRKVLPSKQIQLADIGAISIAMKGEQVCGDSYAVNLDCANFGLFMVVDGLGHGEGAFEAANEAVRVFDENRVSNITTEDLFRKIHLALHKTRGAAMTIAKIDFLKNELEHVGIGNISSVILSNEESKSLVSLNGIVGHGIRKIQSFKRPLPKNFIFIMHSDGLITHWRFDKYPGILSKPANIIAGALYRDYERERDDITILVVKF